MRLRLLVLAGAVVSALAACGGGTPSGSSEEQTAVSPVSGADAGMASSTAEDTCAPFASLPSQEGDLVAYLEGVTVLGGDEGFMEPGGTELAGFERDFQALLETPSVEAAQLVASYGFAVGLFRHQEGSGWLVFEDAVQGRGAGTFVVNLAPARNLFLEAPHADSDQGTLLQGAAQLVALGARAYLITGSNRCASAEETPCSGTSIMCEGRLRIADAAHYDQNFFTSAHRALRAAFPDAVAINLHGMEAEGTEAAVISDGTRRERTSALSVRLRDALNARLPGDLLAFSCNDPADEGQHRPLCGTTNVQGRVDNGSGNACQQASPAGSDRFLHLEQAAALRVANPGEPPFDALVEAIAEVVPCSLPGAGLGCAPPELACR